MPLCCLHSILAFLSSSGQPGWVVRPCSVGRSCSRLLCKGASGNVVQMAEAPSARGLHPLELGVHNHGGWKGEGLQDEGQAESKGRIRLAGVIHTPVRRDRDTADAWLSCGHQASQKPPARLACLAPQQQRGLRGWVIDGLLPPHLPSFLRVCSGCIIPHVSRGLILMDEQSAASSSVHLFPAASPPAGRTLQPRSHSHTQEAALGRKQRGLLI